MPRSNRPRGRGQRDDTAEARDLERFAGGFKRTEAKRSGLWNVQPVSAASAVKAYRCPGCAQDVAKGVAHVVTWKADSLMGDAAALADRRHWHTRCWQIIP